MNEALALPSSDSTPDRKAASTEMITEPGASASHRRRAFAEAISVRGRYLGGLLGGGGVRDKLLGWIVSQRVKWMETVASQVHEYREGEGKAMEPIPWKKPERELEIQRALNG